MLHQWLPRRGGKMANSLNLNWDKNCDPTLIKGILFYEVPTYLLIVDGRSQMIFREVYCKLWIGSINYKMNLKLYKY